MPKPKEIERVFIPLLGTNQGSWQRFTNCVPEITQNPATGAKDLWVRSAPTGTTQIYGGSFSFRNLLLVWVKNSNKIVTGGWEVQGGGGAGSYGLLVNGDVVHSVSSTANRVLEITETNDGDTPIITFIVGRIPSKDSTAYGYGTEAWYYASDAGTGSPTFTADTSTGSPTLTNVSSFSGLYVGQALSGTGIPATAYIQSMNTGASTITMGSDSTTTVNATATNSGVTITRTPCAKFIDVNFPTNLASPKKIAGKMIHMNGRSYVLTTDGYIYNSNLNAFSTYTALGFIAVNEYPDEAIALGRIKNSIVALGNSSIEYFTEVGTVDGEGSPLQKVRELTSRIGCIPPTNIRGSTTMMLNDILYWFGKVAQEGTSDIKLFQMEEPGQIKEVPLDAYIKSAISSTTFTVSAGATDNTTTPLCLQGGGVFHGHAFIAFLQNTTPYLGFLQEGFWTAYSGNASATYKTGIDGVTYGLSGNTVVSISGTFGLSITMHLDLDTYLMKNWKGLNILGDIIDTRSGASGDITVTWADNLITGSSVDTRTISIGTSNSSGISEGGDPPQIVEYNWGSSRKRSWTFSGNSTTALRIKGIEFLVIFGDY